MKSEVKYIVSEIENIKLSIAAQKDRTQTEMHQALRYIVAIRAINRF